MTPGRGRIAARAAAVAAALAMLVAACHHREPADYTEAEALAYLSSRGYAFTPEELVRGAREGALDVVIALLGAGLSPDSLDGRAVAIAAATGNIEMLRLLLRAGADPNLAGGSFGQAPLVTAVMRDQKEAAQVLVEAGADPNARLPSGAAALHFAKGTATARLLLEAGADASAADALGTSPLMGAILLGDAELVDLLLEHGADANAADHLGRTPLLYAHVLSFAAIEERLVAAGARNLPRPQIGMATLQSYTGRYGAATEWPRNAYEILADPGRLLLVDVQPDGTLYASDLLPLDATTFYRAGDPGLVLFRIELEDGRATALSRTDRGAWLTLPRLQEDAALVTPAPTE